MRISRTSLRFAADIDLRDAGNHLRHAHGDEEAIGPGIAFEEDVGAADVRRPDGAPAGTSPARRTRRSLSDVSWPWPQSVSGGCSADPVAPGQAQASAQDGRDATASAMMIQNPTAACSSGKNRWRTSIAVGRSEVGKILGAEEPVRRSGGDQEIAKGHWTARNAKRKIRPATTACGHFLPGCDFGPERVQQQAPAR